ncbi:MAG: membrane dipeptidase [Bdellovibrio sp.]|nr:membrane dipeptidase [Bdellovibrio sp.]
MSRRTNLFLIAVSIMFSVSTHAFIELHSHAFMNEGMGVLFRGDFHHPLCAHSWRCMLSSKINAESLDKSGVRIFVAALYAHPALVLKPGSSWRDSVKESLRRQIKQAYDFVAKHPNWILAKNAREAQHAYNAGKKVFILSLEGSHGMFETSQDFVEFIDQAGIAIVTPIHLINNACGGAAYLRGFRKSIFTLKNFYFEWRNGARMNPMGLTPEGKDLIVRLMAKGVWIDLTHMSDKSIEDAIPLLMAFGQPLLFTHTALRKYYKDERGISAEHLRLIRQSRGYVGLVPSEEMLVHTKVDDEFCPEHCRPCRGGLESLAQHYYEIGTQIGFSRVAFGSDFSGGIPHLRPARCRTETSLDRIGLVSIDQMGDVHRALENRLQKTMGLDQMANEFIQQWGLVQSRRIE